MNTRIVNNLFYPFCVGSYEYIIHLLFPLPAAWQILHKLKDKLCYLCDNWYV